MITRQRIQKYRGNQYKQISCERIRIQMQKILSPNQFLFEQAILEVLKEAKKHIRIAPFQFIQPQQLVKSNNGVLFIDLYHHYFVAAMTNAKTKELACTKYEKILRENLFDRQHLPPQMISSILSACSSTGSSTTGSSHGSTNISPPSQQVDNLYVVNLIKTILQRTPQSSSQIQLGLSYILQGTRNKRFTSFYSSILQQIYNNVLVKIRQQPIRRLVHLGLNHMVNEIEYHLGICDTDGSWMRYRYDENGKKVLCVHDQRSGKGKFGKCYYCGKQTDNYCKDQMVPICSFDCKYRLKEIVDSEHNHDHFNLIAWLIQNLPTNDQIIYSFLGRELAHNTLALGDIVSVLKIIINVFTACAAQRYAQHTASLALNNPSPNSGHYVFKQIQKHALNIFLHILFNYKHLYEKQLAKYFKVFFFQIVRILELISIKRLKINQKSQKGSRGELPGSKQSLQSSLNLSLDSMGNMQSLSNMTLHNPTVNSYLNYQQQFSNPFLNGIIQILSNEDLFFYIYSHFDCKFFEQNLLAKMMNIISQYAKEEIISKEYGFGITGSSAYGVYSILKMLTERLVGYEKHKNLRTFNLEQENLLVEKFLHKYPINPTEVELKRHIPKVIELFNKKPAKGITALKKLFAKTPAGLFKSGNEPLSQSTVIVQKNISQSQQFKQKLEQSVVKDQFEKDVQEIKRRALKLERQNLEASQISIREEDKNISLDNMEQSTVIESQRKQEMTQQIQMTQSKVSEHKQEIQETQQIPLEKGLEESKSEQKSDQVSQMKQPNISNQSEKPKASQNNSKKPLQKIDSLITLKQIAMFLRQNVDYSSKLKKIPLIQKQKMAQYMGSTKDKQANEICYQFFKLDEEIYSNLEIDDCLRVELNYFGTPKEGQQIEIVIDQLSKVMLPHTYFTDSLKIYQYIYTLLMVNSGHNPNVKQSDKVKLDMFLSIVGHIDDVKDKAERDYHKIKKSSLNNLYNWGEMIFDHKYLMKINDQDWLFDKMGKQLIGPHSGEDKHRQQQNVQQIKKEKRTINLKWLMQYIWQFVYISIVNNQKKNSTLGVFQAIILYGKYNLVGQQFGFIQIFKRSYEFTKSKQSLQSLLRLAIEFNNYLYQWSYLISLSYLMEESNTYHQHIDKIFTNLQFVTKNKLKIFLVALCDFSTSEYKLDKGYNRELFVLRHITEILEYNLHRLEDVWDEIWSTIEVYFKGICLHPKRQIAMAAIDSYKQLSLKIFKLKSSPCIHSTSINHSKVLSTYLYIFQRSNIFIKDLIINILQNVVSSDINSGWEIIYEILNINDSEDKTVVMKVVERLVKEVGYKRLTSLEKLHEILVKELRLNVNTVTLIESILLRLWEVSQEINERNIWMSTMKSVKDIYKMSLNNKLLGFWFKIINRCITEEMNKEQEKQRKLSFQNMNPILNKKQTIQREQYVVERQDQAQKPQQHTLGLINQEEQIITNNNNNDPHHPYPNQQQQQQISLDRQIYTQIVDWLIFLIDVQQNQSLESRQSYVLILKQALQHFKTLRSAYIIRYLVGVSGLLNIFTMFIHSQFQTVFLLFFKQLLAQKLFTFSQPQRLLIEHSPQKYLQLITWLNQHFKESTPNDLLNMKKLDEDFKKERKDLIYSLSIQPNSPIIPALNSNPQTHKIELIQFSLSAQDFNLKSISNLILLDCVQMVIQKSTIAQFHHKLLKTDEIKDQNQSIDKQSLKLNFERTLSEIYQNLIENYEVSRKTNNLIALRNFLWNNGFLLYNTFKQNDQTESKPKDSQPQGSATNKLIEISKESKIRFIPGLHKHQKRSLSIILQQLPEQDNYVLNLQILEDFITNYRLKNCLDEEKATRNGLKKRKRQESMSRGRKISEIIKNQNLKNSQALDDTKQQNDQHERKEPLSHQKPKHIKVTQYEKKSTHFSQTKPKVNIIQGSKTQKSADSQASMKQLYLNDIDQWIKLMQDNLAYALRNLLNICAQAVKEKREQGELGERRVQKLSSFLVNDQQMVRIFLLCLDLSGEQNCSLPIMRDSNRLMQTLLKSVLSVEIEYGWKDESQMYRQIEQNERE